MSDTLPTTSTAEIHDLGYRRYDGAREGGRGAFRALYWQGFRTIWGIGRPLKAKVVPVFVPVVTMLPVLGSLAASSASNGQLPIRYAMLFTPQLILFVLFAAAQVPEVLSRDQQHRVLPLMLTRNLTRSRYALARLLAVWSALLCLTCAPLLFTWIGEIGIATVPSTAFREGLPKLSRVALMAALPAFTFGAVAAAIASITPRRAWATAGIIGTFLVLTAVAAGLRDLAGMSYFSAIYLDPVEAMRTLAMLLFDEKTRALEVNTPPPLWHFALAPLALTALGTALMQWRLRKVSL